MSVWAKRDMTRAQFRKALRDRGWSEVLLWINIGGGIHVGKIWMRNKVNLRASLAYAIKRDRELGRT